MPVKAFLKIFTKRGNSLHYNALIFQIMKLKLYHQIIKIQLSFLDITHNKIFMNKE